MKIFYAFAVLLVIAVAMPYSAAAQEADPLSPKVEPVDEAEKDTGFLAFRDRLLSAVVARDVDAVLAMASEDIQLSFGGSEGHAALRDFLEVNPDRFAQGQRHEAPAMRERNWADLETALRMGGRFSGPGEFAAPYTWAFEPTDDMDPYEVLFVTGSGVALRQRPIRFGDVLGRLDYDVVRFLNWVSGTSYVEIEKADGTKGFVHRDYVRFLLDYRALFTRKNGEWKMTAFVAGD